MSWHMTQHGFVSIVFKGGGLMVRSRDRKSIESFCDLAGIPRERIVAGGGTDYQFRVRRVSQRAVNRYHRAETAMIDYSNFKDRAKVSRGKAYAGALTRCWSAMWDLAPLPSRIYTTSTAGMSENRIIAEQFGAVEEVEGYPSAALILALSDQECEDVLNDLDLAAQHGDDEAEALLREVDDLLDMRNTKSVHDMTEDEWDKFMRETPGGI